MKILRKYQKDIFRKAKRLKYFALLLEMRLGKTLIAIRVIKSWRNVNRVLVVLPLEAFDDWIDELLDEREISYVELTGIKKKRLEKLKLNAKWNLINYQGAITIKDELIKENWDMILLDESIFIKNPKAKVTKFFVNSFDKVEHKGIMSGCWDPETDLDMIPQLNFLDKSILNNKNYYQIRNDRSICYQANWKWRLKKAFKKELFEKIQPFTFLVKRKDVGLDKEAIHTRRFLSLPSDLKKPYETLENEMILETDHIFASTIHKMRSFAWMKQVSSGIIEGKVVNSFKLNEMIYLLENDLKNEQVVISTPHKQEIYAIEGLFKKKKYKFGSHHGDIGSDDRKIIRRNFNKKHLKYLIVNPTTLRHGVKITGCVTIIHMSLPKDFDTYNQFKDRILDVDVDSPLFHIYILTRDTVDELDYYRIRKKKMRVDKDHSLFKKLKNKNKQLELQL